MTENSAADTLVERALASEVSRDISVEGLRTLVEVLTRSRNRPLPPVGALHERLPIYRGRDDATVDVIVPIGAGPFPVLLYIHGGAWVAGNPATHRRLTCRFAEAGYLVVSVDYRLAPEHPFPAAFDDCAQALYWIARSARHFGGDASRLAIAGDSAGANLAAAIATAFRGRLTTPRISAALLIYGVFDFANVGGALFAPILHEAYLGRDANRALLVDPRVSPIHGADRLPPCYIVVGNQDPLLADSENLREQLSAAAIEHEYEVIPHMPHGFMQMEFLGTARRTIDRMSDFLQRWTSPSPLRRLHHHASLGMTMLVRRRVRSVQGRLKEPVGQGQSG